MEQYIPKSTLVAEIEKQRQLIFPRNTGEMKVADVPKPLEQGWLNALSWIKKTINTIEVKEVDLDFQRFAKEMDAISHCHLRKQRIQKKNLLIGNMLLLNTFIYLD